MSRASQSARPAAKRAPRVRRFIEARRAPGRDHGACGADHACGTRRARACGPPRAALGGALASRGARWQRVDAHHEIPASFHCRRRGGEGLLAVEAPRDRSTPRASRPPRLVQELLRPGAPSVPGSPAVRSARVGGDGARYAREVVDFSAVGRFGSRGRAPAEEAVAREARDRGLQRGRPFDIGSYVTLPRGAVAFGSWCRPAERTAWWAASSRASQAERKGSEARAAAAVVVCSARSHGRGRRRRQRPGAGAGVTVLADRAAREDEALLRCPTACCDMAPEMAPRCSPGTPG
jgi:hypothetical protein